MYLKKKAIQTTHILIQIGCSTPCLKNVLPLTCYTFDIREQILNIFWQKYYR